MLPSSGYFKNLDCPYFKSGFCCRPHCHYKHVQGTSTYVSTKSTKATKASTYIPTPIERTVPKYKPTPIAELRKRKASELATNQNESLVKVKKEQVDEEEQDCDIIASIVGGVKKEIIDSVAEQRQKQKKQDIVTQNNKNSNETKTKEKKLSNGSKITSNKTKTQLIQEAEELLRRRKSSKDSHDLLKSNCDKPSTKEPKSSSSSKGILIDSDTKLIKSIKQESPYVSTPSSATPSVNDGIKKPTSKVSTDDSDLALLLESPPAEDELTQLSIAKKPRVAHSGPSELTLKLAMTKKPVKLTPHQMMYNRFNSLTKEPTNEPPTSDLSSKKRVAHNIVSKTPQTLSHPQKITIPVVPKKKRPVIPAEFGGKIPMAIRSRYLNNIIDELLKFCSEDDSYSRGLTEEKTIYTRSTSKNVYLNLAVNAIKRIRTEASAALNVSNDQTSVSIKSNESTIGNRPVSHTMILNGPHAEGCSIEKRRVSLTVQELTDVQLYAALKKYVMSINKLTEYGYPRPDPHQKGKVILPASENKHKVNFTTTRRICCRCIKSFIVDEFGYPVTLEACVYHSGRLWSERFNRSIEKKYSCCKGDAATGGCCSGNSHVVDGTCHPNYLLGFVTTGPIPAIDKNGFHGIYALDCEMSYTTIGLELTRVSVIDHKFKCVYESLVKPENPILDYNTKFSGIKEGDLDDVKVNLKEVQEKLLSFIGEKTILIGHSLESDLKALKIVHDTVIDTAEVFPHRRGLPFKRALRTLMAEFMQSIIQNDVDGHDSQEDAVACMKLVLWKVSQDLSKIKR